MSARPGAKLNPDHNQYISIKSQQHEKEFALGKSNPSFNITDNTPIKKSIVELEVESHQMRICDKNKKLLSNKGLPR